MINDGLVTAHSAGKVKVTAKSGSGKSASCTITVTKQFNMVCTSKAFDFDVHIFLERRIYALFVEL